MVSSRKRPINLPAPYLKRIWLEPSRITDREAYPFCLPLLRDDFELSFDRAITIIVGENGTGKSTLLEGIAALAGYDEAGGGKGYMPVDHSWALKKWAANCPVRCGRAGYPKSPMAGFSAPKASFRSPATWTRWPGNIRLGGPPPDFLSHSHGEGFFALLRGALPAPGHLHLRRAGIGAVALAPDRVFEADAADGGYRPLPDHHGHAFAGVDGVSECDAVAADEVWA